MGLSTPLDYVRRAVTWLRARAQQTSATPPLASQYKLLDGPVLGVGFAGTVVRARDLASGKEVAVKRLRPPLHASSHAAFLRVAHNEVACLQCVAGHKHVVLLLERFETSHTFDMVFPLAAHGNLGHYLRVHGDMPEMAAKSVIKQVLAAVAHCHAQRIVHRDIKLENILITQTQETWRLTVQLGDFGFAAMLDESLVLEGLCGTPLYVAPEILSGDVYSMAVDLWSVGVVAYILLAHVMPTSPRGSQCQRLPSIAAQAFVQALLQVDPSKRSSATRLLSHDYLTDSFASQVWRV
ncbi:CAMK protein kinase [Saprolegnia diclina VS20]|uniref:CAMK protein kinase n=1 Tax=Saprolegnia diclina (strain VS20) TaxID=1156394 RepID=T0Q3Y2_SAPDV|nr:CAMK protein kinase [Saprolegnia diclina VS20]EQC29306.1 CAMK protein kinase [Saprolegnia diclina VS20]|eukprot:XP_008617280.1 CAMK protein kinase [Saprolegnia diclina VS20]